MSDPRYPIGKFQKPERVDAAMRRQFVERIAQTPDLVAEAVVGLGPLQLDTPYRDGGWTVRQVTHHVFDSHINAYTRVKLALTEHEPTVKTYDENAWSDLADAKTMPVEVSVELLRGLHQRWVTCLRSLTEAQCQRQLRHPDWGLVPVDFLLAIYAWHGPHHAAHVTTLRKQRGW